MGAHKSANTLEAVKAFADKLKNDTISDSADRKVKENLGALAKTLADSHKCLRDAINAANNGSSSSSYISLVDIGPIS